MIVLLALDECLTDGVLHKFALLSRILGFVDLKTWLSAKVPDPRVNGVPFQTLKADFKGRDGDFYSDDLLLRGPVMNISALGHIRLGDGNSTVSLPQLTVRAPASSSVTTARA